MHWHSFPSLVCNSRAHTLALIPFSGCYVTVGHIQWHSVPSLVCCRKFVKSEAVLTCVVRLIPILLYKGEHVIYTRWICFHLCLQKPQMAIFWTLPMYKVSCFMSNPNAGENNLGLFATRYRFGVVPHECQTVEL